MTRRTVDMQSSTSMPMSMSIDAAHQHHHSPLDVTESQPHHHFRPAQNGHGHWRGSSVDTAQLSRPCAFRPSHHAHHLSVSAIQGIQNRDVQRSEGQTNNGRFFDSKCALNIGADTL